MFYSILGYLVISERLINVLWSCVDNNFACFYLMILLLILTDPFVFKEMQFGTVVNFARFIAVIISRKNCYNLGVVTTKVKARHKVNEK